MVARYSVFASITVYEKKSRRIDKIILALRSILEGGADPEKFSSLSAFFGTDLFAQLLTNEKELEPVNKTLFGKNFVAIKENQHLGQKVSLSGTVITTKKEILAFEKFIKELGLNMFKHENRHKVLGYWMSAVDKKLNLITTKGN